MEGKRRLTFHERLKQLEVALRSLQNANRHYVESRDPAYLLDMMGRLRALVCTGGPYMNPLLLDLMDESGISVPLYSWSSSVRTLAEKSVYAVILGKTWQVFPYKDYVKYSFANWLTEPFYFSEVDRVHYSRNDVIKRISNTQGGAHYDLKVPFLVDKLANVQINQCRLEETMVEHVLKDVAMATFWAGTKFLLMIKKRVSDGSVDIDGMIESLDNEFEMLDRDRPRGALLMGNDEYPII